MNNMPVISIENALSLLSVQTEAIQPYQKVSLNLHDVQLLPAQLQSVFEFCSQFISAGVTSIYVFGSRSRGDSRQNSDLDLYMYTPQNGRLDEKIIYHTSSGLVIDAILTNNPIDSSFLPPKHREQAIQIY